MHHSGSAELDPARSAAHVAANALTFAFRAGRVDFGAGFGERKVRRTKAHALLGAEELAAEAGKHPLQMTEVNALGDEQSFDLMKLKEMARVNGVATKALPGCDDRDRRLMALASFESASATCAAEAAASRSAKTNRSFREPDDRSECSARRSYSNRVRLPGRPRRQSRGA